MIRVAFSLQHHAISYRDLLNLSCVGDDLLHDLHGLTLGLSCLSLTLGCRSLDDLYLLALAHLHGHWRALMERKGKKKSRKRGEIERSNTLVAEPTTGTDM